MEQEWNSGSKLVLALPHHQETLQRIKNMEYHQLVNEVYEIGLDSRLVLLTPRGHEIFAKNLFNINWN